MPPRENPRLNKSLDSVHASGPLGRAHCVIHGNQNYKQTGLLQAYAAYSLLAAAAEAGRLRLGLQGVRPPRAARRAARFGLVAEPVLTVGGLSRRATGRLPGQGRVAGPTRPVSTATARPMTLRRGAASSPAGSPRRWSRTASQPGDKVAILSANDPIAFTCRLRHQPGRRRVVPDQPAQRGRGEPRAARPLRLLGADLPGVVRAAGRPDPRRPAEARDAGLPRRSTSTARCPGRSSSARRGDPSRRSTAPPSTTSP